MEATFCEELTATGTPATIVTPIRTATRGVVLATCTVHRDLVVFEGDIIVSDLRSARKAMAAAASLFSGNSRDESLHSQLVVDSPLQAVAIRGSQYRWPGARVPFRIDPGLQAPQRVIGAIAHWTSLTPITFVERTSEPNYITFRPGPGCSSFVGMQGGEQFVTLDVDCSQGNTIHEIGHAIGLWHEQSREDRDQFVEVHWENIAAKTAHNFSQHITDGDDIGPYDFDSIMHYPSWAFSVDPKLPTLVPKTPGREIGQRNCLSPLDVAAVRFLYPSLPPQ